MGLPSGGQFAPKTAPTPRPRRHWTQQAFDTLLEWQERARQRQALARLDDRILRDIGASRADVAHECGKPFWRP